MTRQAGTEIRAALRRIGAWALWASVACSAEQDGGNPFDSVGAMTTAPPATTVDDDGDDEGTDTGAGATTDDGGDDADAAESSGGDAVGSTTDADPGGSTGDGDPGPGMQPTGTMYTDCTTSRECGAFPQMCLTIQDGNGTPIDGFCTVQCVDPMTDCDPAPSGTATPVCLPTTVNGMPDAVCALGCSGGAVCPAAMTCYDFGAPGQVCG